MRIGFKPWLMGLALAVLFGVHAEALEGTLFVHDPSPVVKCDGRYYVFGTGRGIPILASDDGFTWAREGKVFDRIPESVHAMVPKNDGQDVWAPQVIPLNGEYYLYYSISSWGQFVSAVGLMTNPTLNAKDPRYKWTDRGVVVNSVEGEDLNAIDPGVVLGPDGRLWISYGSYHGNIELVELNPRTGLRISPKSPVTIVANHSEASDIIAHDGYYYLFVNHGSCCRGPNSTYTIRVGRAKAVTGPYLDRDGDDLAKGGGSLFLGSGGTHIGPGQFGLLEDNGVEKFSCHFEGNSEKGGRGGLSILPLLWTAEGWPKAGMDAAEGTYQVRSSRTGMVLELAADYVLPTVPAAPPPSSAVPNPGTGTAAGSGQAAPAVPQYRPPAPAVLAAPIPEGVGVRMGDYLIRDTQNWAISPAGGGFYKLVSVESSKALASSADGKLDGVAFTGKDDELWRLDELSDGSYRIEAKTGGLALTAVPGVVGEPGTTFPVVLKAFTGDSAQRWEMAAP